MNGKQAAAIIAMADELRKTKARLVERESRLKELECVSQLALDGQRAQIARAVKAETRLAEVEPALRQATDLIERADYFVQNEEWFELREAFKPPRLPDAQTGAAPEPLTVFRICEHCNKEYPLPARSSLTWDFQNCSNCGKRDDAWVRVVRASSMEHPK